jgi:hypothetical protein
MEKRLSLGDHPKQVAVPEKIEHYTRLQAEKDGPTSKKSKITIVQKAESSSSIDTEAACSDLELEFDFCSSSFDMPDGVNCFEDFYFELSGMKELWWIEEEEPIKGRLSAKIQF